MEQIRNKKEEKAKITGCLGLVITAVIIVFVSKKLFFSDDKQISKASEKKETLEEMYKRKHADAAVLKVTKGNYAPWFYKKYKDKASEIDNLSLKLSRMTAGIPSCTLIQESMADEKWTKDAGKLIFTSRCDSADFKFGERFAASKDDIVNGKMPDSIERMTENANDNLVSYATACEYVVRKNLTSPNSFSMQDYFLRTTYDGGIHVFINFNSKNIFGVELPKQGECIAFKKDNDYFAKVVNIIDHR